MSIFGQTCNDADWPNTSCCGTVRFIIFKDPQPDDDDDDDDYYDSGGDD